jgi:hypothetical protein
MNVPPILLTLLSKSRGRDVRAAIRRVRQCVPKRVEIRVFRPKPQTQEQNEPSTDWRSTTPE